ncbi:toxic anion resistance protein [Oryzifoliimicrobium ureilyticus]|uniref:toxic anion resistance protein n=1 Tax=Oryzifoliimicrobium ureilyticus TaxID=3113724 RepID=UPI00307671C7
MRKLDATASGDVLRSALRLIAAVNLDDHEFDDVVRFGSQVQQENASLCERQLALAEDQTLQQAKQLSTDLLYHLKSVDPALLFKGTDGTFHRIISIFAGQSAAGRYDRHTNAIADIAAQLMRLEPSLLTLENEMRSLRKRGDKISCSLEAHILAGRFIVSYIDEKVAQDPALAAHYATQQSALENRTSSLSASVASVPVALKTLDILIDAVGKTRAFCDEMLRRDLPAWQASVATALAMQSQQPDASIDVSEIERRYAQLLHSFLRKDLQ